MSDTLTFDALLAAAAELEKLGPMPRIISGAPFCPSAGGLEWKSRRIVFIGDQAVEAIKRATFRPNDDPEYIGINSIVIEPWGSRSDHRDLSIAFASEFCRDLLARVSPAKASVSVLRGDGT